MSFSERISPFVGRLALAWFFLSEAFTRAQAWDANIALMSVLNIPVAPLLFFLALVVMTLGGLSLLLGFHARHGAVLLFGFTILVTVVMHDYWHIGDAAARTADYEIFARNVAIAGALLFVVGMGAGPFAFDNKGQKRR